MKPLDDLFPELSQLLSQLLSQRSISPEQWNNFIVPALEGGVLEKVSEVPLEKLDAGIVFSIEIVHHGTHYCCSQSFDLDEIRIYEIIISPIDILSNILTRELTLEQRRVIEQLKQLLIAIRDSGSEVGASHLADQLVYWKGVVA